MSDIPILNIKIESTEIKPTQRKLKAKWTVELAQDLQMFHGDIALTMQVPWFPIFENKKDICYMRTDSAQYMMVIV